MKILHTADLHIGKKIFELSLIEDQRHILRQIADIAHREQADAVLIAGDVYDRPVPSTEAVSLLDDFLTGLVRDGIAVIMISGNHDSPERVAFAGHILEGQGLYIAGTYEEPLKTVVLNDEYGAVHFVCMPFVKPGAVKRLAGIGLREEGGASAEAGFREEGGALAGADTAQAVEHMLSVTPMTLSLNQRYVLLTHYFVTGTHGEEPELSESETDINVGGLDSVPAEMFANFAYVALGHIHKYQRVGEGNVYYSGSPLKYSFGKKEGEKSVNIVELGAPGQVKVRRVPLEPLHEMRCIRGKLADLISPGVYQECGTQDYMQAVLTDTEELIDPAGTIRSVYPNVLQVVLEKNLPRESEYESRLEIVQKSTARLFGEFYEMLKGEPLDEKRRSIVEDVAESVDGEEKRYL